MWVNNLTEWNIRTVHHDLSLLTKRVFVSTSLIAPTILRRLKIPTHLRLVVLFWSLGSLHKPCADDDVDRRTSP